MSVELVEQIAKRNRGEFIATNDGVVFYAFGFAGSGAAGHVVVPRPPLVPQNWTTETQPPEVSPPDPPQEGILAVMKPKGSANRDRISIGRAAFCDLVLAFPSVSKLHAHFLYEPSRGWLIRDARSMNGTFLNEMRLESEVRTPIRPGDHLRFAYCEGQFLDAAGVYDLIAGRRGRR